MAPNLALTALCTSRDDDPTGEGAPNSRPGGSDRAPEIIVALPRIALVVSAGFDDLAAIDTYLESLPSGATIVTMQLRIAHWASEFPLHVIHVMGKGDGEDDAHERQMLEFADCLVVFWGETGWGTHRAIELAQELGKKFVLFERAKS